MKVIVKKPVTLTLQVGNVVEINDSQLSLLKEYVEVKEEKKRTKKGE